MAPSTIPNAGLGIFTDRHIKEGTPILDHGDVIIPLLDVRWHNWYTGSDDGTMAPFLWPFDDYVWDGIRTMGMHRETSSDQVDAIVLGLSQGSPIEAYAPGLDCAINCNIALVNVDRVLPHYDYSTIPHFFNNNNNNNNPARGAMTPYHNSLTVATHDIPAGGELFKFYGDIWFSTRPVFEGLPLSNDYPMATNILEAFSRRFQNQQQENNDYHYSLALQQDLHKLLLGMPTLDRRLRNALPQSWDDFQTAMDRGIRSVHQPHAIRPYLDQMPEARCLDNIRPGPSTLAHAGRGAFAVRSLRRGQTVTGSPLMHIVDRRTLWMYDSKIEYTTHPDTGVQQPYLLPNPNVPPVGIQLLLNYCWGHARSTLLLCPYGAGVNYINHASTDDDNGANVKLQWAPHGQIGHHEDWLDKTIEDMVKAGVRPHLAWDYVALRDIEEGEELLIDYGSLWQEEWEWHVEMLGNDDQDDDDESMYYKPAAQVRDELEGQALRTVEEQEEDPYPPNVETVCHDGLLAWQDEDLSYYDNIPYGDIWTITYDGVPCSIVERIETNTASSSSSDEEKAEKTVASSKTTTTTYTVEIRPIGGDPQETVTVRNVSRVMISFRDVHMTTDLHYPNAFRHAAQIPDDMFPTIWMNLDGNKDEEDEEEAEHFKESSHDPHSDEL